jgi:hypothetical protein
MGIAEIMLYFGGGLGGATIIIVIILMIADCVRTVGDEDDWWEE